MTRWIFFLQNNLSPRHLAQNRPELGETGGNNGRSAWHNCLPPVPPLPIGIIYKDDAYKNEPYPKMDPK
ncbi:hypothetical protein MNBD_CHLOROFLEXI01-2012 [hydrothermal vent metagenome]|uniref:Uncharacterized protein n=1 Tax=hydrothermal vent metagenome TaxID=652676 RepID=A0A3B0VGI2_9ZZZZ